MSRRAGSVGKQPSPASSAKPGPLHYAALDALPSHIAILDQGSTILFVNKAWLEFGRRNGLTMPDGGVGTRYLMACEEEAGSLPGDVRIAREGIIDLLNGRRSAFTLEYPCHSPEARRWFTMRAARFEHDGETRVVVSHEDITRRRLAEEELRTSHVELEAFNASVSHDLRAPLRRIADLAGAIAGEDDPSEARGMLRHVEEEAARARELVGDLMALSRVASTDVQRRDVDLSVLAKEIIDELAIGEPDREVEIRIQPGVMARADPSLVRIALENLLGNAWKFTGRSKRARVEFGQEETERGRAFYVRDNGVGFAPHAAVDLFRPFTRLASAAGFEGTGVGLATVRRIVERHGGSIWAEGTRGGGAIFRFTLRSDQDSINHG